MARLCFPPRGRLSLSVFVFPKTIKFLELFYCSWLKLELETRCQLDNTFFFFRYYHGNDSYIHFKRAVGYICTDIRRSDASTENFRSVTWRSSEDGFRICLVTTKLPTLKLIAVSSCYSALLVRTSTTHDSPDFD